LLHVWPWLGIVFAIVFVVAFFIIGDTPDLADKQAWVDFHSERGNRLQQILGAYLGIAAAFFFLWFSHALVERLRGGSDASDFLRGLARSAATMFAVLLMLAMLVQATVAGAIEVGDSAPPDSGDFAIQFDQLSFAILLVCACLTAAVFIASVSEVARRARTWPAWLVVGGFIASVVLLFGPFFFPVLLIPLWTLLVGVTTLWGRRGDVARPVRSAATP
jgi:hypothetical protein